MLISEYVYATFTINNAKNGLGGSTFFYCKSLLEKKNNNFYIYNFFHRIFRVEIDIKQTTYKKFSIFLEYCASLGLIELNNQKVILNYN
jgi:hypothetical protein